MAEDTPAILPGDLVQVTDEAHRLHGLIAVATEPRRRHVGVSYQALRGDELVEAYDRLRHDQFVVVGVAHLMTKEVAGARATALRENAAAVLG